MFSGSAKLSSSNDSNVVRTSLSSREGGVLAMKPSGPTTAGISPAFFSIGCEGLLLNHLYKLIFLTALYKSISKSTSSKF
ncbi:hypothetical protein GDO81_020116 [Engystomops pustulosus]|uniref:Uncharacterized protein n=1 Tax=Engystomops pustulosus TaxID=76066 RepID=A0AAV6Z9R6_ENGPU|nr:hypothetical protein GDO81_020116 [Engystomops pustulosus]